MDYFKIGFGLVTESDPITENCNLFYAQYLLLRGELDIEDFDFFCVNMFIKEVNFEGLYNRRSGNDTRSMSHDEITGFMVASQLLKTSHKKVIWKWLVRHWGTYNNTGKLLDCLPFNPGNYYAWGAYAESKLCWLFLPLYFINMVIAVNKKREETSSKIIYWLELFSLPENGINSIMKKYFVKKMRKQYGEYWLCALYEIYFYAESRKDFPLWKELTGYETRQSSWFKSYQES